MHTHSLEDLDIIHSFAYSPQSKGRVERIHRTLQDRLVKAMRLKGICTIEEANAFVPKFIGAFNKRFAKPTACPGDNHHSSRRRKDVESAFSRRYIRHVTKHLTFSFNGTEHVIGKNQGDRDLIGRTVAIEIHIDGSMVVMGACGELKVHTTQ